MVRLVVDHHQVAPAAKQPADGRIRVLSGPPLHRAEHRLRNKTPLLQWNLALADPILALRLERDTLTVAHEHIRTEVLAVFGRHYFEGVVQIVLTCRIET